MVIGGALDLGTAPALKRELLDLLDGGAQRLLVELKLTGQIDSSGLAVLVAVHKRARRAGAALVVVIEDARLAYKFSVIGLDRVLTIVGSRSQALLELGLLVPVD